MKKLVAVGAVVVCGLLVLWGSRSAGELPPPAPATPGAADRAAADPRAEIADARVAKREPSAAADLRVLAASPLPADGRTAIRVEVFRAPRIGIAGVQVQWVGREVARTDTAGIVEFTCEPGSHRVRLEPASLPAAFLRAPWERDGGVRSAPGLGEVFPMDVTVDVFAGRTTVVPMRLFVAARLEGAVVDPQRRPLGGRQVRARHLGTGLERLVYHTRTASNGTFVFARLLPGDYDVDAFGGDADFVPVRATLAEGERAHLAPMVAARGSASLTGLLVDQDGIGIGGVGVRLSTAPGTAPRGDGSAWPDVELWSATTDAYGCFTFRELPATTVSVRIVTEGARGVADRPLFVAAIAPVQVDLVPQQRIDIGGIVGRRSRPFRLRVVVDVDEGAIGHGQGEAAALRPYVVPASAPGDLMEADPLRKAADGSWTWQCETPHEPVTLVVGLEGFASSTRIVVPHPDAEEVVRVRFP